MLRFEDMKKIIAEDEKSLSMKMKILSCEEESLKDSETKALIVEAMNESLLFDEYPPILEIQMNDKVVHINPNYSNTIKSLVLDYFGYIHDDIFCEY